MVVIKYWKYIILALVLVSGLFSCQRDEDIAIAMLNINSEVIESSYTSADIECYVKCNTKFDNVVIEYALSEDFADAQSATMSEKEGKYHAKCVNLLDDTTYYIRYVVSNRLSSMTYKEISSFRTLTPSIPVVHLDSISNIWDVKADAFAHVEFDGGSPLLERGITVWAENKSDTLRIKLSSAQQKKVTITNLTANSTYHARAYAINKVGVAYSEQEIIFTTFALPEVQTNEITDVQLTTAILSGELLFNGNDTATTKGFCWSEAAEPTIDAAHQQIDTSSSDFTYCLSNLKDETKYYVRAYAKNKIGIVYGEEKTFTTKSAVVPTVTTSSAKNITYTSATVEGNVISDGGAEITERGVVYSTSQNPTTSNSKVTSGNSVGSFTCNLTNLQENTKYYVRAYAINRKGTSYGPQASFTTKAYDLPTLTTSSATNISYTSATVEGNVISDGGAEITERGVVYSTSQNPTTSNSKVTSGNSVGSFTCNLTNLQENTKYYVRAYAINRKGTSYGPQVSFTTKSAVVPTVTTSSATSISYTSATVGGEVLEDGGAAVSDCGVVYSTNQNPTTASSKVTGGSGTGSFTCSLTNLLEGTTYYVRAYAINKKGIAYGEQTSFTTKAYAYALPTVTTSSATNISYTSAIVGGNVTSDGGATVTERGVVYSTSQNPTTSNSKKVSGSGIGSFSVSLTGLLYGTTYYVRAYAINKKGTAYGEQISFMTIDSHSNMKAKPFSISSSRKVYFSPGNLQYHPANNQWHFAPSQLDYIGEDNSSCSSTYNGWLDLFGWSTSATNFGVSTSTFTSDYSGSFVDWGTNKIGSDAPNTWRTLTYDEWEYLLRNRPNASSLKGVARVNGVNGLIFLPDNWTCPAGVTFKSGFHNNEGIGCYAAYQTFTTDQWSQLEAAGAVFLPAAGYRYGFTVYDVQNCGDYWSATEIVSDDAYYFNFFSDGAYMRHVNRHRGRSVRLVKDL